ncbi:MAG: hypothetical protein HYT87_02400 [Nitrospirae bacterium]|nr:hypothetical protein [Nitrospirota bacterium]
MRELGPLETTTAVKGRDGGKIEYVTYFRSTGPWTGEIRLVEVELQ